MSVHEDILDILEKLEVKVAMIEFLFDKHEGVGSMITYLDLQQTDDIKENRNFVG